MAGTRSHERTTKSLGTSTLKIPPVGGRYQYVLLAVLSAAFGIVFFDRMIINALMPFIRAELDLSNGQVGLIGGMSALTWAISALLMGWLSDRIDRRKPILILAVLAFTLFSAASGFAGGIASLLVLRSMLGAAEGGTLPIVQSLLFFSSEEKKRGLFVGIVQGAAPGLLGGVFSPLIGVWLAESFGWRAAFFATVIPGLVLAGVILYFVKELRQRDVKALADLNQPTAEDNTHKPSLKSILRNRNVLLCLPIGVFFQAWFTITQIFGPTYLVENRGLPAAEMATVMSGIGVAWVLWGAVIPALSDRIGRKPTFIVFTLIAAFAPIVLMYVNGTATMFLSLVVTYTGLGCMVLFMTVIPGEAVSKIAVGTVVGLVMGFSEITGGFMMPVVAGYVADAIGLDAVMWIAAFSALVAAGFACFLRETAPAKLSTKEAKEKDLVVAE